MRVVQVTKTNCRESSNYGSPKLKCVGCNLTVKIGERVLLQQGSWAIHLHPCLVEMVGNEPEFHDYETDFDRIKKELVTNGGI